MESARAADSGGPGTFLPMPERTPLIIDTDGGIDDAVALFWAAVSHEVDLVAVTVVWGNVDVGLAAANVCRVLDAAGRTDVPVAVGLSGPVAPAPELRKVDFIHGADGLGNANLPPASFQPVDEPAVDLLRRLVDERPGEVVVVPIGPFSNIAAVLERDASWAARVKRLVAMGGAVELAGNALPAGEANVAHDPFAAQQVVEAAWVEPPLLVGLDVTHRAVLTLDDIALAREGRTPAARFLAEPLAFYEPAGGVFCDEGEFPCHDALAVMAAVREGLVDGPILPLAVQVSPGPAWGATVADRRQPYFQRRAGGELNMPDGFADWQIGLHVDAAAFRREIRRMFGGGE
jgi:purine nucleosidase